MGVISVRFNKNEQKLLKKLSEYYHEDNSVLIKKSLINMYENICDENFIKDFELKEKKGKIDFITAEEILNIK